MQIGATVAALAVGAVSAIFAKRAAKLSEPTGNGWVVGLGERLDQQDAVLARLDDRLAEHIRDHAFSRPGRAPRTVRAVHDKDSA